MGHIGDCTPSRNTLRHELIFEGDIVVMSYQAGSVLELHFATIFIYIEQTLFLKLYFIGRTKHTV